MNTTKFTNPPHVTLSSRDLRRLCELNQAEQAAR